MYSQQATQWQKKFRLEKQVLKVVEGNDDTAMTWVVMPDDDKHQGQLNMDIQGLDSGCRHSKWGSAA